MTPQLLGLCGYARSGKDSVAWRLHRWGYQRVAFADALRQVCYDLNPTIELHAGRCATLQSVVDTLGWEMTKTTYSDARRVLQRMGTEVGRAYFGANVWIDLAMAKITGPTVFTDVRFPNEADAIRERGGQVWRIERHGYGPVNGHASETAMDGYDVDWVIWNSGTLDELATQVDRVGAQAACQNTSGVGSEVTLDAVTVA